jgi:hypothetical protein
MPLAHDARLDSVTQLFSPIDALTLTGGARYDDTTRSAAKDWWRVVAYRTPTTLVRASYGEFQSSDAVQLFSEFGNQALAPEQAEVLGRGRRAASAERRAVAVRATSAATLTT